MTTISITPGEIFERVLDFLHDDHAALCSSSLANREWVSTARLHLFNPMIINEFKSPDARAFLSLVQSPYSTILPAIRQVVLNIATLDLISDVVNELKRSKALKHIVFLDHSYISDSPSLSWIALALPNIYDFSYNTTSAVHDDVYRLFASLPKLQSLAIYTEVHTTFTFPVQIPGPHFLHISTLRLKLLKSEQFLNWLQTLNGWNPLLETLDLRIFRICHRGWGPVKALNSFLKANSSSLRHLSLGIDYAARVVDVDESICGDNEETPMDLSALSNLSTVFLRTHDINAIFNSLASLHPSSRLEALNVHVLRWEYGQFRNPGGCDCAPSQLLESLASIMEERQSFAGTAFDLRISKIFGGSELETVWGLFRKWEQRAGLKVSSVDFGDEEDYQVNSHQSIRHLLIA